jgi:hypothetical protein
VRIDRVVEVLLVFFVQLLLQLLGSVLIFVFRGVSRALVDVCAITAGFVVRSVFVAIEGGAFLLGCGGHRHFLIQFGFLSSFLFGCLFFGFASGFISRGFYSERIKQRNRK